MNWLFVAYVLPAVGLYLWFKLTEKNLLTDWQVMFKDGLASGVAASWIGGVTLYFFDGWVDIVGAIIALWSLTYWAAAVIAWRNVQAIKEGKPVTMPFSKPEPAAKPATKPALNRQQRRRRRAP